MTKRALIWSTEAPRAEASGTKRVSMREKGQENFFRFTYTLCKKNAAFGSKSSTLVSDTLVVLVEYRDLDPRFQIYSVDFLLERPNVAQRWANPHQ